MGFIDNFASIGKKSASWLVGAGKKVGHWGTHLGSKSTYKDIGEQMGKGVHGVYEATKAIDETPILGYALSWIPFEQAVVKGVDLAEHVRQVAKGEGKWDWGRIVGDVLAGGVSAVGGSGEIQAFKKAGKSLYKGIYAKISPEEAIKGAGEAMLKGQLGEDLGGWVARKGGQTQRGLQRAGSFIGRAGKELGTEGKALASGVGMDIKSVGRRLDQFIRN